ncbi:MAG: hypothetical protein L3J19_07685, partial [Sulfurimonas sp.]|nr:hypothetical protein [Sulfurimonas sp.]
IQGRLTVTWSVIRLNLMFSIYETDFRNRYLLEEIYLSDRLLVIIICGDECPTMAAISIILNPIFQ